MKDHEICELVNTLRDIAVQYRDAQQLRAHIHNVIVPVLRTATSWTPANEPPDSDTTVLLALTDGEVWQGYLDGDTWRDSSSVPLADGRVAYWQHTPTHPEDRA